jgi:hypothetical protein
MERSPQIQSLAEVIKRIKQYELVIYILHNGGFLV